MQHQGPRCTCGHCSAELTAFPRAPPPQNPKGWVLTGWGLALGPHLPGCPRGCEAPAAAHPALELSLPAWPSLMAPGTAPVPHSHLMCDCIFLVLLQSTERVRQNTKEKKKRVPSWGEHGRRWGGCPPPAARHLGLTFPTPASCKQAPCEAAGTAGGTTFLPPMTQMEFLAPGTGLTKPLWERHLGNEPAHGSTISLSEIHQKY